MARKRSAKAIREWQAKHLILSPGERAFRADLERAQSIDRYLGELHRESIGLVIGRMAKRYAAEAQQGAPRR